MTIGAVCERLRKRLTEYRHANRLEKKIQTPINLIEMALNLTEFAIDQNRAIREDEQSWFDGNWPMIHKLDRTEWDDIVDLYRELGFKVKERDWFRKSV